MLILSRKPGESIVLDGGITVVVLACDKGGVRLGIEAPASVSIVRGEIVRQVADENRRAGAVPLEEGRALLASLGVRPESATKSAAGSAESAPAAAPATEPPVTPDDEPA
jgi:carbon storage regulator